MSPLAEADQKSLLKIARRALAAVVSGRPLPELGPLPASLQARSGVFVTLRRAGRLRGCIGHIEGWESLARAVQECAVSAALHDPRFPPVTPQEIPELHIEISVLSPLVETAADQIEVGKHGLLISTGRQRGLLLPQVAVEWNWDRERFLEETCLKAGLAQDAWRSGVKIQSFTAEIFSEQPAGVADFPAAGHSPRRR